MPCYCTVSCATTKIADFIQVIPSCACQIIPECGAAIAKVDLMHKARYTIPDARNRYMTINSNHKIEDTPFRRALNPE
jgi:hypothetical protein